MRFDYYAATLPASVSLCTDWISKTFKGVLVDEKPVKPYKHGVRHHQRGFRLYWGGENPHPFFVASGASAIEAAAALRSDFPHHRVSRADVAFDFRQDGGFDRMVAAIDPIARASRVAVCFVGDPDNRHDTGRTMYYGSPKSDVRIVVYEKGLHEASRGDKTAPRDWVRVELRVRPRKDRKALCRALSPSEMWGLAKWSVAVSSDVLGAVTPYQPDQSLRRSNADKAVSHMLRQYAASLRAFCDEHGQEELFARIREVVDA